MDAKGAKEYVDYVQPKIVVPMHYKTAEHNFDVDGVDKFLSLFAPEVVTCSSSDTLTLYDNPTNDVTKVVVLQRFVD